MRGKTNRQTNKTCKVWLHQGSKVDTTKHAKSGSGASMECTAGGEPRYGAVTHTPMQHVGGWKVSVISWRCMCQWW